jgi:hypothetical protein
MDIFTPRTILLILIEVLLALVHMMPEKARGVCNLAHVLLTAKRRKRGIE